MHDHLRTVIVAPMTTGSHPAPFRISITHAGKQGLILLDQIRTVDKIRLVSHFGKIQPRTLKSLLDTMQEMFSP